MADVTVMRSFYQELPGVEAVKDVSGTWALRLGNQKGNLQPDDDLPVIARNTLPGTGNLCLLWVGDVRAPAASLCEAGVKILADPAEREGAMGVILSIYFHDPDGNLFEVGQPL